MRSLAQTLQATLRDEARVAWEHVKGHTRCLGNEIADTLAKFALQEQTECGAFNGVNYLPYITGERPMIAWLWLYSEALTAPGEYGLLEQQGLQYCSLTKAGPNEKMPKSLLKKFSAEVQQVQSTVRLTFASYNVGTLREHGKYSLSFMPVYLREQIQAHSIDILCLQETRANVSAQSESDTHVRLVSAAVQGHGGTEIWILKSKTAGHRPHFSSKGIVILHADAELLIAKFSYKQHKIVVVSGHAPQSGKPHDEIQHWWQNLDLLLAKYYDPAYSLVLCLDANAHFSCPFLPHVGAHGLEATSRTFCSALAAPADVPASHL